MAVTIKAVAADNSNAVLTWLAVRAETVVSAVIGVSITVDGDFVADYGAGVKFLASGTAGGLNDGEWESDGATLAGGDTVIACAEIPATDLVGGGTTQIHRLTTTSDNVDMNSFAVAQVGALSWLTLVDAATGGSLALTDDFTCPLVTNAALTCAAHKLAAADVPTTAVDEAFTVGSDVHDNYPAGKRFLAAGTVDGTNNGEYVVGSPGATFAAGVTTIPCTVAKQPSDQANETGTLQRHVSIAVTTGVAGDSEGLYNSTDNPALTLSFGAEMDLIGDVTNSGTSYGLKFTGGNGILSTFTGDVYNSSDNNSGIYFNGTGTIVSWVGDVNNSGAGYGVLLDNGGGLITDWVGDNNNSGPGKGVRFNSGGILTTWVGDSLNSGSGHGLDFASGGAITNWIGNSINSSTGKGIYFDGDGIITDWTYTIVTKVTELLNSNYGGTITAATLNLDPDVAPAADVRDGVPRWTGATPPNVGTYPSTATSQAAQRATDVIEANTHLGIILSGQKVLTDAAAGTMPPPNTIV